MVAVLAKLFGAASFLALGAWFWRMGRQWDAKGEIPKEWVESIDPKPVKPDESSFGLAVGWQKAMGALMWLFAFLFLLSIFSQVLGML